MVSSTQFWESIRASLEYLLGGGLLGQVGLGLAAALFLRTLPKWIRQSLVVLIVLAWVIPEIVGAFVWSAFLQTPGGLLDAFVQLFGISAHAWLYQDPMLFVILAHAWKGVAFSMLVLGAAIDSIPKELIEAARVDGATSFVMLTRVTLPMIRNALATVLVLVTLWTLADFTLIFILTGGGPLFQTDVLTVFTYQNSFSFYELGYGTALSLVLLVISGILSLFYLRLVGRQES
jgi:multiple sugar transport system permease protein